MHGYYRCVRYYFINFTYAHFFLSLLCAQQTQWLLSSSSFFSDTHKHTHTQNIHTDKSTRKYINTPTHKQTHVEKPTKRQIEAWSVLDWNDWCLTGTIDACGSTRMGFDAGGEDQCWQLRSVLDWNDSLHVHLLLWVDACGRDNAWGLRVEHRKRRSDQEGVEIRPRGRGDLCSELV